MIVQPLAVDLDGLALRATRYLPDGDGPHDTVVLHHGFSSNRIEVAGLFPQLARRLAARGIASVAFDRLGHGESDGSFFHTTASGDVRQAHRFLRALLEQPGVQPDRIHLLGMSLGSVVASVVAAETDLAIRSLTLWSPAAIFHDDAAGGNFQGRPIGVAARDGYVDNNGLRLGLGFFEDARGFDPYERARGFDGPVRIISGSIDDVVPSTYAERYRDVYGDAADITIVDGADHLWFSVPVRDVLLDETERFIGVVAR